MPNKTKCSDGRKAQYKAYRAENRRELNAALKLERHLKKHPNDKQSLAKR